MSAIAIVITEPGGSPVDYTADCIFQSCSFSGSMGGVAGRFSVQVRDPDRTLSFVTGSEITLSVDGVLLFGGYVTTVDMGSFAPAADTSDLSTYYLRTWTLSGPDYNIIFDRRFWRNTADYLHLIDLTAFTTDGAILREAVDNYADVSDFDSSGITDIAFIAGGDQLAQGDPIRKEFENLSQRGGAVWYIRPDKTFIYVPYDAVAKRWGFSDAPNKTPITVSPDAYQGATYGFREVTGTEDASFMVNDALIWGGSQFGGSSGGTVFDRVTDAASISAHNRWQTAETHFGEKGYQTLSVNLTPGTVAKTALSTAITGTGTAFLSNLVVGAQLIVPGGGATEVFTIVTVTDDTHIVVKPAAAFSASGQTAVIPGGVEARAQTIINGPPGADVTGQQKGLKYPQWQFTFTWFSADVPLLSGVPDHIRPGDILNIELSVFGVTQLLPVRELRISFPDALEDDGTHLVQFDATFGLQLSDPYSLWRYLLTAKTRLSTAVNVPSVVTDSSTSTSYGSQYSGVPTPATDGATTVFMIKFPYITGSTAVFLNGLIQRLGVDYTESDPATAEITFTTAPLATDNILVTALTLAA